jgi:hypothetical protein
MGLAERRAIKIFQEGKYTKLKEEIDRVAGFEVDMDINWDSLGKEGYAEYYEEYLPKVYFRPLIDALKGVCVDDLGREALREGLKKVVLADEDEYNPTFVGGKLMLHFGSTTYIDDVTDRKNRIQATLEKGL